MVELVNNLLSLFLGVLVGWFVTLFWCLSHPEDPIIRKVERTRWFKDPREVDRLERTNLQLVQFLHSLEELVYTGQGGWVKGSDILPLLRQFSTNIQKVRELENSEGSTVYRHGDNGSEPEEEQAPVSWPSRMAQWPVDAPKGDTDK